MYMIKNTTRKVCVPANAMKTWSSKVQIFRTVLSSWSMAADFFSTPSTTMFFPLTPTCRSKVFIIICTYKQEALYNKILSRFSLCFMLMLLLKPENRFNVWKKGGKIILLLGQPKHPWVFTVIPEHWPKCCYNIN